MFKKILILFSCILVFLIVIIFNDNVDESFAKTVVNNDVKIDVSQFYNTYVVTTKKIEIYKKNKDNYVLVGDVDKGVELVLDGISDKYFKLKNDKGDYYIKYNDLKKIDTLAKKRDRYKKYVVFNKNIITKEKVSFCDEDGRVIYKINESLELPIFVLDNDKYGVSFNERLLYVGKDDVLDVVDAKNTDSSNIKGISVLNYHFIYNSNNNCTSGSLCVSETFFSEHLKYIKDNDFFTITLEELEKYIDGKIQLPKSVVITADDGYLTENYKKLLEEYQLNGTMFMITAWYNINNLESDYVEYHSHGDDLHNVGVCPGGQGGAIKCMDYNKLLNDLVSSSKKLKGSKYFAYPFYEYNDYSIKVLKDAGYRMAFIGEREGGQLYVSPGMDKFRLPRRVVVDYTTIDDLSSFLNLQ